jgi:(p)ppGpp synthase/HD superfamily hydrolase
MNAEMIELALHVAMSVHRGQVDKGGFAYIFHPIRVMMLCQTDAERVAALLHDVVEDGPAGILDQMADVFPPEILEAVEHLTKRKGESYPAFIDRCCQNPIARAVKMADLTDNSDLSRIPHPTREDWKRKGKYLDAMNQIRAATKGDGA